MYLISLFLCGALSGVIGGMGMGGGTLLIPALIIFFGVSAHNAAAVNLISFIPTAIVSLIVHVKNGLVEFKGLIWLIVPALISCVAAFYLSRSIDSAFLSRVFGWFLLVLAALSTISIFRKKRL